MIDFVKNAFPFIVIGIGLAMMCANFSKKKRGAADNYLTEGMCLGICLGVALSAAIHIHMGVGISLGMLIGEITGMLIKKK